MLYLRLVQVRHSETTGTTHEILTGWLYADKIAKAVVSKIPRNPWTRQFQKIRATRSSCKDKVGFSRGVNTPHLCRGCHLQKTCGIRVPSFQSVNWISGIDWLYLVRMFEINGSQLLHVENWTPFPNVMVVIHMCSFRWEDMKEHDCQKLADVGNYVSWNNSISK